VYALRHAVLPFRPAPLVLVATFTLGLGLATRAGIIGIPLALIIVSWFAKYCFALFDAAVAGQEPPVLSVEMINPVSEPRPLAQALIIVAAYKLLTLLESALGEFALITATALLLTILPANITLLGISRNPFYAVYPPALVTLIRGLGRDYILALLATLVCVALVYGVARFVPTGVTLVLIQLAFLFIFAVLGGAVHENRLALGLSIRTTQEHRSEREQREHTAERHRMLDRCYALVQLRRTADAWREIEQWVRVHCVGVNVFKEFPPLIEATASWDDPTIADRVTNDYLARLLAVGENGVALDVVERRLLSNPTFLPAAPANPRRLAELARLAGKGALQRRLAAPSS
jgi:hypothetical protein